MLIKICGITDSATAQFCLEQGVDMLGFVYYPPSPRHLSVEKLAAILDSITPYRNKQQTVLVLADALPPFIDPRIDIIQLHGSAMMPQAGSFMPLPVIRDKQTFDRLLTLAPPKETSNGGRLDDDHNTLDYVLELSRGILPGGNGSAWDWSAAEPFCRKYRTLLAGGITPDNVCAAAMAKPAGIDVSSGIESAPGIKDLHKIEALCHAVRNYQRNSG